MQGVLQRLQPDGDLQVALQQNILRQAEDRTRKNCSTVGAQAVQASAALRLFAQSLLAFAQQQETIRHDFTYAQRLGLDSRVRTQPAWSEIEIQWDVAAQPLRAQCNMRAAYTNS